MILFFVVDDMIDVYEARGHRGMLNGVVGDLYIEYRSAHIILHCSSTLTPVGRRPEWRETEKKGLISGCLVAMKTT